MTPEQTIVAAGCVVWRPGAGGPEIALVHRPRYDDWSFPKGKLERGESLPACAVREVAEESGVAVRIGSRLGVVHYRVPEGPKVVHYWAAQARGGDASGEFTANDETDQMCFVDVEKAAAMLTQPHDVDVLRRFAVIGPPVSTVLLVRHAKAGSRTQWDGNDRLRPLSGTGRDQAAQLAALLRLFGPDRIASAPPVRCVDTVAPLATATGLAITDEPLLGEERYWDEPGAGFARLRALADHPGVVAVCSQGGVIPDVVGALATDATPPVDVDPEDIPSRKASTWVLTFAAGALRAADYYRTPTVR